MTKNQKDILVERILELLFFPILLVFGFLLLMMGG
jgi:hypothetical protein